MRSRRRRSALSCSLYAVSTVAAFGAPAVAAPSYSYTDLGTFGGRSSRAYDINNNGQVTGWAWALTTGTIYEYDFENEEWIESQGIVNTSVAFLYDNGQMIDIGQQDE